MWKFFFLDCWWPTKEYWLEAETALHDPMKDLLDSAPRERSCGQSREDLIRMSPHKVNCSTWEDNVHCPVSLICDHLDFV